ncbi:MAG TPA: DUF2637 domain-containing protein [Pseudonocardiaceae bacterium]|nr:DUF2637 domain-containing protein [Pseudonocardiaceae bacterium]
MTTDELTPWDRWTRRLGALAVAAVAAYASYQHQRDFALAGGADLTTARLWPLSVDGLLVLSTAGLLRDGRGGTGRARYVLRATFAIGIIVSLAANIATAPSMAWAPILVAGWPPVALLLAVELVGHQRHRDAPDQAERDSSETNTRTEKPLTLIGAIQSRRTAEQVMWDHYQQKVAAGLPPPTGAELDEVAKTNNYGRAVLRKWRRKGRTSPKAISVAQ